MNRRLTYVSLSCDSVIVTIVCSHSMEHDFRERLKTLVLYPLGQICSRNCRNSKISGFAPFACIFAPSSPLSKKMRSSAVPRSRNKTTAALVRNTIRKETRRTLLKGSHDPFPYQLDAAVAVATGRDTVLIAPTGAGKTLVLAMPLLYHKTKVSIIISPLQALETDQALKMNQLGIKSILVDSVDLPKEDVQVC